MRIGELAQRVGVSTRALRYYEEQGLLTPSRTAGSQRVYAESDVDRVRLIQQLFTAGLNSHLLVRLLPAIDAGHLDAALVDALRVQHEILDHQLEELEASRDRLTALIGLSDGSEHSIACPATLDEAVGAGRSTSTLVPA